MTMQQDLEATEDGSRWRWRWRWDWVASQSRLRITLINPPATFKFANANEARQPQQFRPGGEEGVARRS